MARQVSREVLERLQVQEAFDCWNRDELEPMLAMYAEDAVFDVSRVFTDVEPKRGHTAMLAYWQELRETWGGGMLADPVEAHDLGAGRFAVDIRLWGKGTRSGVEIDQRFAFLYTLGSDGRVISAELFAGMDAAIAAGERAAAQARSA